MGWRTIPRYVDDKYIYALFSDFFNIVELYNRAGDKEAAKVQTLKNTNFMEAVVRVEMGG